MRNSLRLAAVGTALSALSFASLAHAAAAPVSATATAEVLSTLSLAKDADLNFGQIAANTGGTVVVKADQSVSHTGTLISTGTRSPAKFTVTGAKGASVVVILPTASVDLTRVGGTDTMTLSNWDASPTGAFQIDSTTGTASFNVGGELTVGSGQAAGVYEGTFDVSVEYQ